MTVAVANLSTKLDKIENLHTAVQVGSVEQKGSFADLFWTIMQCQGISRRCLIRGEALGIVNRSNLKRESRQWYRHQSSRLQGLIPQRQYARRVPDDLKRIECFDIPPLEDFLCL